MRVLPCADAGLLIELPGLDEVRQLYLALSPAPPPGVADLVPAARTLLLRLGPEADPVEIERIVRGTEPVPRPSTADGLVRVPVVYDGDDLADVAALTGLTIREVIDAHTSSEWTVAFSGFAPGFGYLAGGDERLRVPRGDEARTRVPAGAVGLAGPFTGIYPRESPGGWRLLGRTDLPVWSLDRDPPALLRPGVRVRFDEVGG